jgi:hypothetical protein
MPTMPTMRNAADCGKGMFFQSEPLDPPRLSVGKSSSASSASSEPPWYSQLGVDLKRGVGLTARRVRHRPEFDVSVV